MKDEKNGKIGLGYALSGIFHVIRTERNFRIHLFIFFLAVILGFILRITIFQWCLVLGISSLVFTAEMINTAIEQMIDYMKPERHPSAKIIKDVAAGAVLISAVAAAIIGLLIFLPKLARLLH